jgi:ADP-heptose:LPS heptosyltransferase
MDAVQDAWALPSVLVTADQKVAAEVQSAARHPFVNLAGQTSLKQLAAVLRRCAVHVCGDTGSGHLAAALGRPVVALIGPTDPDRACPYGQRANVLSRREMCGAGCDWHHCEYASPRCMAAISVADVLQKLAALLAAKERE